MGLLMSPVSNGNSTHNSQKQKVTQQLNTLNTQYSSLTSLINNVYTGKNSLDGGAGLMTAIVNAALPNTNAVYNVLGTGDFAITVNGKHTQLIAPGATVNQMVVNPQGFLQDVGAPFTANDLNLVKKQFPNLQLTTVKLNTWLTGESMYGNAAMLAALKKIAALKEQVATTGIPSSNSSLQNLTNLGNQMVSLINNAVATNIYH